MFNLFERKNRDKSSYAFLDIGFHGDGHLISLVDYIFQSRHIESFIETGTNVGTTLAYVAKRQPTISLLSCEPDSEAFRRASGHVQDFPNVEVFNMVSQQFIELIQTQRSELFSQNVLFWLDAHGYGFEWPLKDELHFISQNFSSAMILIDDFKVPGLDCFGYDHYGEQICSYDYVKESFVHHQYRVFYPSYTERTSEHHPLRGWGLFVIGQDFDIPKSLEDKIQEYKVES